MHPAWFKLLEEWQDSGRFGLTVPFLYGALNRIPNGHLGEGTASEKLFRLLASIADEVPDGKMVRLFICGTVRDLTLAPVLAAPGYCRVIATSIDTRGTFYVQQDLLPAESSSISDLHAGLWRRYGEALEHGRFSLRNGTFAELSEADLALIDAALSRPDDEYTEHV